MNDAFKLLQQRFGRIDLKNPTSVLFGDEYINGIKGWQFPEETILDYNREGKLLTMDLDVPCPCKLNWVYCFVKGANYYEVPGQRLSYKEIKEKICQAKELGLQISGASPFIGNPP